MATIAQDFQEIMQLATVIAAAIVRQTRAKDDLISQRQAYDEYGRRWIEQRTAPQGTLTPVRQGGAKNSKLMYSRFEIASLIEAERRQQEQMSTILTKKR
jgi:hypothetical protein